MAVLEDYEACRRIWPKWARHCIDPHRIVSCSSDKTQLGIITTIYPRAMVLDWNEQAWNLNLLCPAIADIIVACNVFHYSPNPELWFSNCLKLTKFLWLQDLFCRQRGPCGKETSDVDAGDCMRYGYGGVYTANQVNVFDLARYQDRLIAYEVYDAGSYRSRRTMINFVACIRGDLR